MRCSLPSRRFGLSALCAGSLLLTSACTHPPHAHPPSGRDGERAHQQCRCEQPPREAPWAGALDWPIDHGAISSEFGSRRKGHPHLGIDIRVRSGTPIRAAAAGRVTFSGRMRGYGKVIVLDHGDGLETRYAHNHRNLVRKGESIEGGELIGEVGTSGNASAPHLHFEVREYGHAADPILFLPPSRALARQ